MCRIPSKITPHPKLNTAQAEAAASRADEPESACRSVRPVPSRATWRGARMGALAFNKLRGCVACHQGEGGQGGLSGPELTDAGPAAAARFHRRLHRRSAALRSACLDADAEAEGRDIQKTDRLSRRSRAGEASHEDPFGVDRSPPRPAAAGVTDSGRAEPPIEQLYDVYCVQCHGLKRNGTGVNLPGLSVRPRDHTDTKGMGDTPDERTVQGHQGRRAWPSTNQR